MNCGSHHGKQYRGVLKHTAPQPVWLMYSPGVLLVGTCTIVKAGTQTFAHQIFTERWVHDQVRFVWLLCFETKLQVAQAVYSSMTFDSWCYCLPLPPRGDDYSVLPHSAGIGLTETVLDCRQDPEPVPSTTDTRNRTKGSSKTWRESWPERQCTGWN